MAFSKSDCAANASFSIPEHRKQGAADHGSNSDNDVPHCLIAIATCNRLRDLFQWRVRRAIGKYQENRSNRKYGDTCDPGHSHGMFRVIGCQKLWVETPP
jgi:hypothetical protein